MPIQDGNYVAPEWVNGQPPAINAQELNDMSQAIEDSVYATQTSDSDDGTVAYLLKNGQNIWAKTVAEAVKASATWGDSLDTALQKLEQAVIYNFSDETYDNVLGNTIPMVKVSVGSYVGTGKFGTNNPNVLSFAFVSGCSIGYSTTSSGDLIDLNMTWDGNTIKWSRTGSGTISGPELQLNESGIRYFYVAVG